MLSSPNPQSQEVASAFDPGSRVWIPAGRNGGHFEKIPSLDGTLLISPRALDEASDDFGHVVSRRPSAVLRPGSVDDIIRMVRFARQHRIKIGPRGTAHTMYAHTHVEAGIVVDMSTLATIHSIGEDRAVVDAGVLWSELIARAVSQGRTFPVLTDLLEMSVGGTLSVGGVSGTSYRYGVQLDNVLELQVVTGEGELVTCSPDRSRDLFEAVLGGLGQCGIIARATVRLVPAPARVRLYDLGYADHRALIQDELRVIADGRFDYVLGVVIPTAAGGWVSQMHSASYLAQPDDERMLAGLSHQTGSAQIKDVPYLTWVNSLTVQLNELKRLGHYTRPHPWCDLLVPASRVESFLDEVFKDVPAHEFSPYFPILLYPLRRAALTRPLFRVPEEESLFLLDLLRTASPETRTAAQMVAHNRQLFERNRSWGGTHYTISAIECSAEDWKQHYGAAWKAFEQAKRRHDPDLILTPGPRIFG